MAKKYLIHDVRYNAHDARFESLRVWDLEEVQNWSNVTKYAKTMRGAISALNKDADDQYSRCYSSSRYYEIIKGYDIKNIPVGTDFTTTEELSFEELFARLVAKGEKASA